MLKIETTNRKMKVWNPRICLNCKGEIISGGSLYCCNECGYEYRRTADGYKLPELEVNYWAVVGLNTEIVTDAERAKQILSIVSTYFNIPIDEITGKSRKMEHVTPRQIIVFIICRFTCLTLTEIGLLLGSRHYATIIYSRDTVKDLMYTDKQYNALVSKLITLIK